MPTLKVFDAVCTTVNIPLLSINLTQSSIRMLSLNCFITTPNYILIRRKACEKMKPIGFALHRPCDAHARSRSVKVVFFFFFFCVPSYISGVHHFGRDFPTCDQFFYSTIEVVIFRLGTWCMLGVVFVAGIRLSRTWMSGSFEFEQWKLECMCAQTRSQFILSSERLLGNEVRTHGNSKGKIPSTRGSEEGWNCDAASCRTVSPKRYWLSYSGLPVKGV